MKREYLMLAQSYKEQDIRGWWASEKLDGMRCFWDGGLSAGLPVSEVPYANSERDNRVCTGLFSRYGHPIHASDDFLSRLPRGITLDGELYAGRKGFQQVTSICRKHIPDPEEWLKIQYHIFDSPSWDSFLLDGTVKNPNMFKIFNKSLWSKWVINRGGDVSARTRTLEETYLFLREKGIEPIPQILVKSSKEVNTLLEKITSEGGEGLMLRYPKSYWVPVRSKQVLKVKRRLDDVCTVEGYTWGKGKYIGMLGNLICNYQGRKLELSGMRDSERELIPIGNQRVPDEGGPVSKLWMSIHFPLGCKVEFKYRELSDEGVPKEAAYWRKLD
jgi:DNA ligase-1